MPTQIGTITATASLSVHKQEQDTPTESQAGGPTSATISTEQEEQA